MLFVALEKSAGDPAKTRDELEKIKNFVGVSGIFNMSSEDHNGLTPEAFVMVKISGKEFKLIN
jgi:branched-chain amino acid transport system substrate-binding protein